MKKCTKCGLEKTETEFCFKKSHNRLTATCTECNRINEKAYREKNKIRIAEFKKEYQIKHKERLNKISNTYRQNNTEKRKAYLKSYNSRRRILTKERRENDPLYRAKECLRNGVGRAFALKGWGKLGKSEELLGASFEVVKKHIERQFKPGMSWERRGEIHIDHIVPLSSATTIEEVKALCHYSNLQPLWALDNLKKNSKILPTQRVLPI